MATGTEKVFLKSQNTAEYLKATVEIPRMTSDAFLHVLESKSDGFLQTGHGNRTKNSYNSFEKPQCPVVRPIYSLLPIDQTNSYPSRNIPDAMVLGNIEQKKSLSMRLVASLILPKDSPTCWPPTALHDSCLRQQFFVRATHIEASNQGLAPEREI